MPQFGDRHHGDHRGQEHRGAQDAQVPGRPFEQQREHEPDQHRPGHLDERVEHRVPHGRLQVRIVEGTGEVGGAQPLVAQVGLDMEQAEVDPPDARPELEHTEEDQRRGEEDKIAEREVASRLDVDGVARPAQPPPETRAVWVGGEAGLRAHEHERARQGAGASTCEQQAIEIGAGVDTGIDEHR